MQAFLSLSEIPGTRLYLPVQRVCSLPIVRPAVGFFKPEILSMAIKIYIKLLPTPLAQGKYNQISP